MAMDYRPHLILLDPEVVASPIAERVCATFPAVETRITSSTEASVASVRQGRHPETQGKRILLLSKHRGRFLKPCPGICDNVSCCDYHIVDLGSNCPLECTYCVLQTYLNNPLMVVYTNVNDLLGEIDSALAANPSRIFRIGTGELTDSLALDALTGVTRTLVPYFAARPRAFLELKTKTTEIDNLPNLDPKGQTVVAWSLNTPHIIATEEYKTSTLEARLDAARRCGAWGYRLAFHFDPLVYYADWEPQYHETIQRLFDVVPARYISWISLGTLRFPTGLKSIITRRFPKSIVPLGEMIQGVDGKERYIRPLRTEMYRKIVHWIRQRNPGQTLYLCMESPRVWEQVVGTPVHSNQLAALLDRSLVAIA